MISVKDLVDNFSEDSKLKYDFNLLPSNCLSFGETLCIISNNNSLNTFILNNYIVNMLSKNDIRIIYLDYCLNFIYSKFKAISESQNVDVNSNFDKIIYIPIPSPTQMLLVIEILKDYLKENKDIKVLVVDKMNFYPKWNFRGSDLNTKLNRCYKGIKKLQADYNLLFIYTKTIELDENNIQNAIQSHYKGFLDEQNNKNTVVLAAFPSKTDYKIFATRFKKKFDLDFKICSIKEIASTNSHNIKLKDSLVDNIYSGIVNIKEGDECKGELEEVQKSAIPTAALSHFNLGRINENVTYY